MPKQIYINILALLGRGRSKIISKHTVLTPHFRIKVPVTNEVKAIMIIGDTQGEPQKAQREIAQEIKRQGKWTSNLQYGRKDDKWIREGKETS